MKYLNSTIRLITAGLVFVLLSSSASYATDVLSPVRPGIPGSKASIDIQTLHRNIVNQLALASGYATQGRGGKIKAKNAILSAQSDIDKLKGLSSQEAFIREQEETITEINELLD